MTLQAILTSLDTFIPVVIGGAVGLLALVGLKELFQETKLAFKKGVRA